MIWTLFLLLILIIIFLIKLYNKSQYISQRASIDENIYMVLDLPNKDQAADRLAAATNNTLSFINHLYSNRNKWPKYKKFIKRLKKNYQPGKIKEGSKGCSYVKQKGEELVICLRDGECFESMAHIRKIMLHELSHIGSVLTGHGKEFNNNHIFIKNASRQFFSKKKSD